MKVTNTSKDSEMQRSKFIQTRFLHQIYTTMSKYNGTDIYIQNFSALTGNSVILHYKLHLPIQTHLFNTLYYTLYTTYCANIYVKKARCIFFTRYDSSYYRGLRAQESDLCACVGLFEMPDKDVIKTQTLPHHLIVNLLINALCQV